MVLKDWYQKSHGQISYQCDWLAFPLIFRPYIFSLVNPISWLLCCITISMILSSYNFHLQIDLSEKHSAKLQMFIKTICSCSLLSRTSYSFTLWTEATWIQQNCISFEKTPITFELRIWESWLRILHSKLLQFTRINVCKITADLWPD